ncbi:hypothetical protein MPSEU_000363900 [Mayamaea pseudoterrestris]|nr:hypothetical protein MPSEU_000363900 [Mayamaea pseudoterrestris]
MAEMTGAQTLPKLNDRVRVSDSPGCWWLAKVVENAQQGTDVCVQIQCNRDTIVRSYPLKKVQCISINDSSWLNGLDVDILFKNKKYANGTIIVVDKVVWIKYSDTVKDKRPFKGIIDHLYDKAEQYDFNHMPWNYNGPKIEMGTEMYKKFHVGWFYGVVDDGPILIDGGYAFHVTYSDGDDEYLLPEEVASFAKLADKQRKLEIAGKDPKKSMRFGMQSAADALRKRQVEYEGGANNGDELTLERKEAYVDEKPPTTTTRKRQTKKAEVDFDDEAANDDDDVRSRGGRRMRKMRGTKKGKVSAETKQSSRVSVSNDKDLDEIDSDSEDLSVVAVRDAETKPALVKPDAPPTPGHRELGASLSSMFGGSLHSKYCSSGAQSMERMLAFHRLHISQKERMSLIDALMFGPMAQTKATRFPDKHRTAAVVRVAVNQLQVPEMHDKFAADVLVNWKCMFEQSMKPLFAAEGDEKRTNHDAVSRIGETLYVKAHCMELLARMLEHEQQRCAPSSDAILKRILLSGIAQSGNTGSRGALELAVKAYTYTFINHGNLIAGRTKILSSISEGPTSLCLEQAKSAAVRLYRALGKIVSIFAWLYGIMESENVLSVSHLIASSFLIELNTTSFNPVPFLEKSDGDAIAKYWKEIKLQYITGLDRDLVPQLRPHLADKLKVAVAYNCIFE